MIMFRTITLTRKLFTMLLSVIVYKHRLTPGQWSGAAVVFAGISVEAWVKRKGSYLYLFSVERISTDSAFHRCTCQARHSGEGEGQDKSAVISYFMDWCCIIMENE